MKALLHTITVPHDERMKRNFTTANIVNWPEMAGEGIGDGI